MSSEEMRMELETVRQRGLREGWTGWPLKVEACVESRIRRTMDCALPVRGWLCRRDGLVCPAGMEDAICLAALAVLRGMDSGESPMCVPMGTVYRRSERRSTMRTRMITIGVVACVLALMIGGLCLAHGAGGTPGRRDPRQFRPGPRCVRRMMENMKQQLGADDEAWKVIEPRLTKVMELSRDTMAVGRGMFGGMRGRMGPGGPGGPQDGQQSRQQGRQQGDRPRFPGMENREPSAVEKATQTLNTTLENQSASAETIKTQLTALRAAREKAKQDLAAAQQDLRQILTLRQEAQLVVSGMLN